MNKRIVIIAEKNEIGENINQFSVELDYSSKHVTESIIMALQNLGYTVIYYSSPKEFQDNIKLHKNDIVFSTLWGGYHSRNKRSFISAICESYGILYIGADTYVQSICQNKYLTKLYLSDFNFKYPKGVLIHKTSQDISFFFNQTKPPYIIKPNDEGCSVGISETSIAKSIDEAKLLIQQQLKYFNSVLIEEFIFGKEISICIIGNEKHLDIVEAVELQIPNNVNDIWGFESKRINSSKVKRKIVTSYMPKEVMNEAKKIFLALEKVDVMRIDGKLKDGKFSVIELSPDCSLHPDCFISTACSKNGVTYEQMLQLLINNILDCNSSYSK